MGLTGRIEHIIRDVLNRFVLLERQALLNRVEIQARSRPPEQIEVHQFVHQDPHLAVYQGGPILREVASVELQARSIDSLQTERGTEEGWADGYERFIRRFHHGARHQAVTTVFLLVRAASIQVDVTIRGFHLSGAIQADKRWSFIRAVNGGCGRSRGNVFYHAAHKRGMVDIFEEGLEGSAGRWVIKIVKRRLETCPKALELEDKKARAGIAVVESVGAAGNALQTCCVGVSHQLGGNV